MARGSVFDAQDRSNDGLRRRRGEKTRGAEIEPHHLQLSEFLAFAARTISPMPSAWIAVVGDTGYVFKPDSDGSWFYALAVATQHKLASMSRDNYRKEDYRKPTITFVPFEHDEMTAVIKFAYKVADLPPETRALIEAKPKTWTFTPETQASLEADPKWKAFFLRLELTGSVTTPAGQHHVFKMKGEETCPRE
ncbi:hypothetical protein HDV63DRAFT_399104 [Trichoderma sp. SZMC 28014]